METVLAFVIGGLYAAGVYMLLRRSFVKLIIGLVLLSQASNLLIFAAPGLSRAGSALVEEGETVPPGAYADPVPQALILTAIVIGFGVIAFAMVLLKRVYETIETDDLDDMKGADR